MGIVLSENQPKWESAEVGIGRSGNRPKWLRLHVALPTCGFSRRVATLERSSRVTATSARRSRVGAASVHAPIAVLANYFHDSIPVDGVWVENGKGDSQKRRAVGVSGIVCKWDRL